jgi:ribosomal protein S6
MEKEITDKAIDTNNDLSVYEVSYLLLPSIASEGVSAKAANLKATLTNLGGAIVSDEDPVLIDLSYGMTKVVQTERHKANSGYFGWMKFEIEKEGIEKVKKALDSDMEVLRYLIIKTVRENTLLNGKMKFQKEDKPKREDEMDENPMLESVPTPIPEEIDKSIDDLVIA